MKVPLTVNDFIQRAELLYPDRFGIVDEPDQPAESDEPGDENTDAPPVVLVRERSIHRVDGDEQGRDDGEGHQQLHGETLTAGSSLQVTVRSKGLMLGLSG